MYTVAIAIWYIGSLTKSVFKVNSKDISNIANSVKFFNNSDICNLLSQYKLTYRVISGSLAERAKRARFWVQVERSETQAEPSEARRGEREQFWVS